MRLTAHVISALCRSPKTEIKHNMNTKSIKTTLIADFAAILAPHYRNRLVAFNLCLPWDDITDKSHESTIASLAGAIPEAVTQFLADKPNGFPTKQSLRSYLGTKPSSLAGPYRDDHVITGFDDLYNELLALFSLKHVVELNGLREANEGLAASGERKDVEIAKIRTDFGAATNSYERELAALRKDMECARTKLKDFESARTSDRKHIARLISTNEGLQRKNEELVGLPKPYHWDDVETMGSASNPDIHDSLDYKKTMNATISRLAQRDADAGDEVAKLRKSVETLGNQVLSAKAEEWDRCISVTAGKVSEILKEFKIESPTNDILDMVRAACERSVASDGLLDRKNGEIAALKSKQFESPVEKVMAFHKEHRGSIDDGTMGQIVHYILTASDLAEHTRQQRQSIGEMDATALGNSRGVVGFTPVPERQYEGGVPRTEIIMMPPAKNKHDKFDTACGLVCLGGCAAGILFYAAKYLGLLS